MKSTNKELAECAYDYMHEFCGQPEDTPYLIEEINEERPRGDLFAGFMDYMHDTYDEDYDRYEEKQENIVLNNQSLLQ